MVIFLKLLSVFLIFANTINYFSKSDFIYKLLCTNSKIEFIKAKSIVGDYYTLWVLNLNTWEQNGL